jgi:hypothetical protein
MYFADGQKTRLFLIINMLGTKSEYTEQSLAGLSQNFIRQKTIRQKQPSITTSSNEADFPQNKVLHSRT